MDYLEKTKPVSMPLQVYPGEEAGKEKSGAKGSLSLKALREIGEMTAVLSALESHSFYGREWLRSRTEQNYFEVSSKVSVGGRIFRRTIEATTKIRSR